MKLKVHPVEIEMLIEIQESTYQDRSLTSIINLLIREAHREVKNEEESGKN